MTTPESLHSAMTGLEIRDATVSYPISARSKLTAVDAVSLDVPVGEVIALVGPSGSGKSSLLRAIAGLEPLESGTMTWQGSDIAALPTARRGIGMMFQDAQLFGHLSVARNVAYGLNRWPRAERRARVDELLDLVGLTHERHRRVTQLSGGQAQRVALARSLAPRPRILLLDEPLAALDRTLREHLTEVLATTLRATGTTAIHVTHDQDEAFAIGERVGVMMSGQLRQIDAPARLWGFPASEEIAGFLGYGPIVDAELAARLGAPTGVRTALAPDALLTDDAGTTVPVTRLMARRGVVVARVRLPDGQEADLRYPMSIPLPSPGDRVSVRINPTRVVSLESR